jgi:hypothetical protein
MEQIMLVGTLIDNPETSQAPDGTLIATFHLQIQVTCQGDLAEEVADPFGIYRGSRVRINGQPTPAGEIMATEAQFVD